MTERSAIAMAVAIGIFLLAGACSDSGSDGSDNFLIRIGDIRIAASDYRTTFEMAKYAYPEHFIQRPEVIRTIQTRILAQLTEEAVVMARAKELNISLTDAELEIAVSDIRDQYPEGLFEETLLEQSIPFESWKHRLERRLIMKKVVEIDLSSGVEILPEDIADYYRRNYSEDTMEMDSDGEMHKIILRELRREKTESAYKTWIENLKETYTVEINQTEWQKISGVSAAG